MAWLYVPEGAGLSADCAESSGPSATSKAPAMQLRLYGPGFGMGFSQMRRSGTNLPPSTGDAGVDGWISSLQDSPVRILVRRAAVKGWKDSEAAFFTMSCGWPLKRSPRSYSLKTSQGYDSEAYRRLGRNWPMQALIADGVLYPLTRWAPANSGNGGLRWPTLRATSGHYTRDNGQTGKERLSTSGMAMLWAALTARDYRSLQYCRPHGPGHPQRGQVLTEQVSLWQRSLPARLISMLGKDSSIAGRVLNPQFCEALMGWEIGTVSGELSRPQAIHVLGNGVVPACAREAFKRLMGV